MAPIQPASPELVKEYLKATQILDSTKESIASAVANNKSLGEALISDVSVSTLFLAKTSGQLQLAISLHGKQDERINYSHRFYSNLLMNNLQAFSMVVKTANLKNSETQITQLDFDKLLEKGSKFKEGEVFTRETLEELMKKEEFTNQATAPPYAQIATADLAELLNLPEENLDQFHIEPIQLLLNLVNTCISPDEDEDLKKAYKEVAKRMVSVLSCLLIKENHNLIITVQLEKNSDRSTSSNSKLTDTFLQTKTSWNVPAHNSPQRPPRVTSPLEGAPETEDKDHNKKESPIIIDDNPDEEEELLERIIRGEIPVNGNKKRPLFDDNETMPKSAKHKLSDSATKAKERMESYAKPKFNLSTNEGTLQSIAYASLMNTTRSAWNNADKAAQRSLQSLSRSLNGVDLNIISTQLLNILNDNLSPETISREVSDAISTLKQVYIGSRNTTKMNPMDTKTVSSMLKGEICNDRPVVELKEVAGLSPLSFKPAAIPCETIKTNSGQVIYVPQNGTAGILAQLEELNMFLTLGWSHQIIPSLEHYYSNKSVEEAKFVLEEEPAVIVILRDLITEIYQIQHYLDEFSLSSPSGKAFSLFLAKLVHNAVVQGIVDITKDKRDPSGVKMELGIEKKLKMRTFSFQNDSSTGNPSFNNTHSSNKKGNTSVGSHKPNTANNKSQKKKEQKGFYKVSADELQKYLSLPNTAKDNIPSFKGKMMCLRCMVFGDNSCCLSKKTNSQLLHNSFPGSESVVSTFANKCSVTITKQYSNISKAVPVIPLEPPDKPAPPAPKRPPKQPSRLVKILSKLHRIVTPTPTASKFKFEYTEEAATYNSSIIEEANFDLSQVLLQEPDSVTSPNFEFRNTDLLGDLFALGSENTEDKLRKMVNTGIEYPIDHPNYKEKVSDLHSAIEKSNNSSTRGNEEFLASAISKEVNRGWQIPILVSTLKKLTGAGRIKIGVATRTFLDAAGKLFEKLRMTHDCSQAQESGHSVNNLCDKDKQEKTRYGKALYRFLFNIHNARSHYPTTPILQAKFDLDSAYRRCFARLRDALLCCTMFMGLAFILLRLPFGSSPAAGEFSVLTEFIADLANQLVLDPTWDPWTMHSNLVRDIPMMEWQPALLTPVKALKFKVTPFMAYIEIFIDDFLVFCLHQDDLAQRAFHVVPYILDCIFRPADPNESVHRPPILSPLKLLQEGTLKVKQIILGWVVDTNAMKVYITSSKAGLILLSLEHFISIAATGTPLTQADRKQLESLIGKLQDVSILFFEGRFFLNRLRYRHKTSRWKNRDTANRKFDDMEKKDLYFWRDIISKLKENATGWSLDHILPVICDFMTLSDASEHGMGGYFILNGVAYAWRFELPPEWRKLFTLNLLEFIAAYWTLHLLIKIVRCISPANFRVLAITDSSSALGWMRRNCFNPHLQPCHDIVSRAIASELVDNSVSLDRGHIKGDHNLVSDSFSRDTDVTPLHLCEKLLSIPETKAMLPSKLVLFEQNGEELSSFLQSMVGDLSPKQQTQSKPIRSTLELGRDGTNTYSTGESASTRFSRVLTVVEELKRGTSSSVLPSSYDMTGLVPMEVENLLQESFDNTSEQFVRHSLDEVWQIRPEYNQET